MPTLFVAALDSVVALCSHKHYLQTSGSFIIELKNVVCSHYGISIKLAKWDEKKKIYGLKRVG